MLLQPSLVKSQIDVEPMIVSLDVSQDTASLCSKVARLEAAVEQLKREASLRVKVARLEAEVAQLRLESSLHLGAVQVSAKRLTDSNIISQSLIIVLIRKGFGKHGVPVARSRWILFLGVHKSTNLQMKKHRNPSLLGMLM